MVQNPLQVEQSIQMARSSPLYRFWKTRTRQWSDAQDEAFIRGTQPTITTSINPEPTINQPNPPGWREASFRAIPRNKPIPGKPHARIPQLIKTSDGRFLQPNAYIAAFVTERTGTSKQSRKSVSSRQQVYRCLGGPSWKEGEVLVFSFSLVREGGWERAD